MTDDTNPAPAAEPETKRNRGRPTIAEIEAREQAVKEQEEALALRERELELEVAERNADMRARDLERAEAAARQPPPAPVAAARSGGARTGDIRTETVTEPLRRRRYHGGEVPNEFHIPEDQIPDGISYQWNNYQVFGQNNPSYDAHMQMQGWVPVDASRHPHLMPAGHKGPIIVKGQILMERPVELTREALQEDYDRAIGEVRAKEEQLYGAPPGTMPRQRANGTAEFNSIKREIEPGTPIKPKYQYEDAAGPVVE